VFPQYRLSVAKSKVSQCFVNLDYLKREQQIFHMLNDRYATSQAELGSDAPAFSYARQTTWGAENPAIIVSCVNNTIRLWHILPANKTYCAVVISAGEFGDKICQSLGGEYVQAGINPSQERSLFLLK
jgi:hypothetical protein